MPTQKKLPVDHVVPGLARRLAELGFREVYRSSTGSRYLRLPGWAFKIRLSDHWYSHESHMRNGDVLKVFVPQPTCEGELPLLAIEIAVQFVARVRHRLGLIGRVAA